MILRTWRGSTRLEDEDRYRAYLGETGVREYKDTPGNRGVFVVRRERAGRAEFVLLTLWDSMEAVERFAGSAPNRAVFYPEDEDFLVEKDEHVDHYEILEGPDFEQQGNRARHRTTTGGVMKPGFTEDPDVALSGLIGIALMGVLVIGGGLVATGLLERSWVGTVGGAGLLVVLSSMVWRAGRVVRGGLKAAIVDGGSGA